MRKLYSALAVLALGVSLQAIAAPREITYSAQVSNLTRDGKPVSSVKTNASTLFNNSVLAGKITYDLDGSRDVMNQNYVNWPDTTEWFADSSPSMGPYGFELQGFYPWSGYDLSSISIYNSADRVSLYLHNVGLTQISLVFSGPAHSIDGATTFGDVLDRVLLGTDFTVQAAIKGWTSNPNFFWTADLAVGQFQDVSPVPEPSTAAMAAAGLFVLGAVARRRKASDAKRIAA